MKYRRPTFTGYLMDALIVLLVVLAVLVLCRAVAGLWWRL